MRKNSPKLMLSFELHSLLRDLLRNFWLIILAAMIAVMGTYVIEHSIYKAEYTSSATVVVRAKASTSGAFTNFSASTEMANIFKDVFVQPSMKKLAAENIGEEVFGGTLTASVNGETNLMTLSVTASDPQKAYILLKSVLQVYPKASESVFSDAVIDILVPAQMPVAPSNYISGVMRGQIAFIAVVLMALLIVAFSLLRDTVKTQDSFNDGVAAKLLGIITHEHPHLSFKEMLTRKKRALLINDAFATLRFSEDYQKVATKLEYMCRNGNNKVFLITSIAENEGKSTSAANIAIALAGRGYRVVLADFDIHKPSVYKIFNLREENCTELSDVLSGKCSAEKFKPLRYKKSSLYLALNKNFRSDSADWIDSPRTESFIKSIKENSDFVILDTPPISVSADAVALMKKADKSLLVVRTDCVAVADINDTVLSLEETDGKLAGCILNDVYKPFTFFGQMGMDENGYYGYKYGSSKQYGKYGNRAYQNEFVDDDIPAPEEF